MKKGEFAFAFILGALILFSGFTYFQMSGNVAQDSQNLQMSNVDSGENLIGPSSSEVDCMKSCASIGCEPGNMTCMKTNGERCQVECGLEPKPEETEETSCMEKCVVQGCDEFDFSCQNLNKEKCEKDCGMIKEPEAKNEEEQCIRDCVNKINPGLICGASKDGETGNELCQRCAQECVNLYAGPCLGDKELKKKQKECETCKHCYGEPVMGDSGEGWECIVDVECKDSTSEFGDQPGEGPGVVEKVGDAIGGAAKGVANFFKNLFTKEDNSLNENTQEQQINSEENVN